MHQIRGDIVDLIDLGQEIKKARRAQKLSQGELVQRSKVSRARLDALENGRISDIGFKNLVRVMNALGLDFRITQLNDSRPTLEDLIEEEGNAPRLGRR
jgi:transcriptional regulator with XRE-family HTH domain